jgi:hypothetical protein
MTLKVRTFLGADDEALSQALEQRGPMGPLVDAVGKRLSGPGQAAVGREVASATGGLLDLDLGAMLIAGWRTHAALRTAAQATLAAPTSTQVVELASHRIRSTYQPHIDLYVNDQKVYELALTLSVSFDVHSLIATIRRAHIVALRSGRCDVTIQLSWAGGTLLQHSDQIDAPLVVSIGSGIPVLRAPEPPTPEFRGSARVSSAGSRPPD